MRPRTIQQPQTIQATTIRQEETREPTTLGVILGLIGYSFGLVFSVYCMVLTPLPLITIPLAIISAIVINLMTEKFDLLTLIADILIAVWALTAISGLSGMLSNISLNLLVSNSILSSATALSTTALLTSIVLPVVLPVLMLAAAGISAWYYKQAFGSNLLSFTGNIFIATPANILLVTGNLISNVISGSYHFIRKCFGGSTREKERHQANVDQIVSTHQRLGKRLERLESLVLSRTITIKPDETLLSVSQSDEREEPLSDDAQAFSNYGTATTASLGTFRAEERQPLLGETSENSDDRTLTYRS